MLHHPTIADLSPEDQKKVRDACVRHRVSLEAIEYLQTGWPTHLSHKATAAEKAGLTAPIRAVGSNFTIVIEGGDGPLKSEFSWHSEAVRRLVDPEESYPRR